MIILNCQFCNKEFEVSPNRRNSAKYCSKKCYSQQQSLLMVGENNPSWKGGKICQDCGKSIKNWKAKRCLKCKGIYYSNNRHPNWTGKTDKKCIICDKSISRRAIRCNQCSGLIKCGSNNHNWRGGVSKIGRRLRTSSEYLKWRLDIFRRDNFTCQLCNKKVSKIEAHHIKKFSDFPELKLDINNGITLCKECHKIVTNNEEKYEQFFEKRLKNGTRCF